MEKNILQATRREVTGKKVGVLRREGKLPAVMYGHKFPSTPIVLDLRSATKVLNAVTGSSLVTIVLDGAEHAALVREKQRDYIRNVFTHIDFLVVSLTEKIRASVPVELHGVSPAVKSLNGVIVTGLTTIEVECLPNDLPQRFVVSIAGLENIGDGIYVRDLELPAKVEVLAEPEEMIVIVTGSTEEVEAVEGEGGMIEPEVIERGKKDEEDED